MSAGQPSIQGSLAALSHTQADRIARLFAEGQPAHRIALIARCTRARVLQVADSHGWTLDAHGVLPRHLRPAVTPGRPLPPNGSGLAAARPTRPLPPILGVPPARSTRPHGPNPRYGTCARPDCDNHIKSLGLCAKHYMRQRRAAS